MATKRIRLPGPPPTEGSGSTPLTIEFLVEQPFLATREHARFVEFAEACAHYRYIGVCHGRPGVGKTRSAREFSSFPDLGNMPRSVPLPRSLAKRSLAAAPSSTPCRSATRPRRSTRCWASTSLSWAMPG
ncbi:hypothetical protein ACFSHP_16695 [Novosphingobium panipatense]